MGRELEIHGEEREYEEDTTVEEVKEDAGLPANDVVTYVDESGEMTAISDDELVEKLPDKARVASHPDPDLGR